MYPWLKPVFERCIDARSGHAWLIYGSEGLGKHSLALALAKYKLCHHTYSGTGSEKAYPEGLPEHPLQACGQCQACLLVDAHNHSDLYCLETDKAAIGVDEIRDFTRYFQLSPQLGTVKVGIIQDAHKLNHAAANALLKMLEEPPGQTLFFLVTPYPWRLLPTIRSRCQRLFVQDPKPEALLHWARSQKQGAALSLDDIHLHQGNPKKIMQALQQDTLSPDALNIADVLRPVPMLPEGSAEQLLDWVADLQRVLVRTLKTRLDPENTNRSHPVVADLSVYSTVQLQQLYQNLTHLKQVEADGIPPNFRLRLYACLSEFSTACRNV